MNALLKLLPEPTNDQTVKRAIAALVALGMDRSKITYRPEEFRLDLGDEHRVWLGNLHAECSLVWPWQRGAVARKFLAYMTEKAVRPTTLREARPHLLPGVRDSFMFETVRLQARLDGLKDPRPSGRPLGSRLWLSGFLDKPNSTSVVSVFDLEKWGASDAQWLEAALENLAARSKEPLVQIGDGVYLSPWQDCYDPARIFIRDVIAPLQIRGDPVAFAPNWNHLLVTGADDIEGLAGCLTLAMKIMADEPRPMSALPLVRRGGEWVDLDLPKGHVVEPLLRKARVFELTSAYEEQRTLMDRIHEKERTDIYVAKFNGLHNQEKDDYDSYALWSKGVVMLLPRTERVVFFDDDQPEKQKVIADVDWGIAVLHCGSLMGDAGYSLPRYLVESFPTAGQLEAMRAAQAARAVG